MLVKPGLKHNTSYCRDVLKVNAVDGYCRTALHYAAECDDPTCLQILLDAGADIEAVDGSGDTALHWAAFRNHAECVSVLLRRSRSTLVDAADIHSATPLSWAARRPSASCVDALLRHNADPDRPDSDGRTPLSHAVRAPPGADRDACVILLLRASGRLDPDTSERIRGFPTPVRQPPGILEDELAPHRVDECRRLCQLCRAAIRRYLGRRYLPDAVADLPLPKQLRDFLLLLK